MTTAPRTMKRVAGSRPAVLPLMVVACLAFQGCGTPEKTSAKRPRHPASPVAQVHEPPSRLESSIAPPPLPATVDTNRAEPSFTYGPVPIESFAEAQRMAGRPASTNVFSFSAKGLEMKEALALFARNNQLNIVSDPEVNGLVTVDFRDLPIDKAMEAILGSFGYYAVMDRGLIRVRSLMTESFTIDYIRLVRGGNGNSSANVSSGTSGGNLGGGASAGGGGGGNGGDGASMTINQTDDIRFWEELETQLQSILAPEAKLAINRMAGQILVTDSRENVEQVRHFIQGIKKTLHRQVDIEARIYEVILDDEFHLGVDWQNVTWSIQDYLLSTGGGLTGVPTSRWIVDNPIGGFTPGPPSVSLALSKGNEQVVLQALKEQGDLEVVSQPRIRTMNNQAALVKVGSDKPFFRQSSVIITGTGPSEVTTDTEVQVITIGTILSITPQISEDGWITMDISPVITRLVDTVEGPDGTTAPEVDIKQTSSLVRLRSNETVVIGGLVATENAKSVRKVPLLGDIPLLGKLFQGVFTKKRKVELVIFVTPTIVE